MRGKAEPDKFGNPRAEHMRLRALYRRGVLRGAFMLRSPGGLRAMRQIVGPDCAYHLYRGFRPGDKT